MISFICKWFSVDLPIPDVDILFGYRCDSCALFSSHATRGGRYGVKHCYYCGAESPMFWMTNAKWRRSLLRSWSYLQDYPRCPYNWHTLTEADRFKLLRRKELAFRYL